MEVNDRIQNSSVYAISQIGYSKTSCSKITWISILTGALIGCCYQIYGFIDQYFKYPVIVDLLIEQPENITFPAVTICNLNRMKSEYEPCVYNIDALKKCHFGRTCWSFRWISFVIRTTKHSHMQNSF
ncbi:FMRFamide-activated amiloride-sensitive sodium channel [Caerostris extrusa]|uniref:FMRFamide-activated amiloride-sensitive sodium channel n=1 Tax=Caerostris extrusa TaxID=172846 RepID=A0AAV4MXA0_CAEEX|nr:FMRFamide-activated amiloride-sensitive sodium channel [Caerostris extrusa]